MKYEVFEEAVLKENCREQFYTLCMIFYHRED